MNITEFKLGFNPNSIFLFKMMHCHNNRGLLWTELKFCTATKCYVKYFNPGLKEIQIKLVDQQWDKQGLNGTNTEQRASTLLSQ